MRVIGGTFGGRRLRAVDGHATRPTSDRVREALFSRLEARYGLRGAAVLDMFAGTGALAIEAMSRGAARAVCIEMEKRALATLRDNVREFGLDERIRVYADDSRRVVARLTKRFDGVFLDPPYGKGLAVDALQVLAEHAVVKVGGWVAVEVGRREPTPQAAAGSAIVLERVREDAYGDTKLALYEALAVDAPNEDAGSQELPAAEVER